MGPAVSIFDDVPPTSVMLAHLLEAFRARHVLVLGDLMLDEYINGACERVSPEAPVPVVHVRATRSVLGGAGNTAANLVALGAGCTLAGRLAPDASGLAVRQLAAQSGVSLIVSDDLPATTRKVRIVGERQQIARLDYEAEAPSVSDQLASDVLAVLETADAVVISDYGRGAVSARLCAELFEKAGRLRVPVIVDPRPQHRGFYRGCDFITPNWKEALALLGQSDVPLSSTEQALRVAEEIARRFETTAVVTLGARGMAVAPASGESSFAVAATAREVFDVSGAGDTVVAVLALALAAGADLRRAVHLATRAAGIVVGKLGTATVTADELLADAGGQLLGRSDLAAVARGWKACGKTVVTINGSFDLLHAGHLAILEEARAQGDVLIVGLNSDSSVRGYKGPNRPLVPQDERARLLLALRVVDYVHIFDEPDPVAFIEEVVPDVHVNGAEYGEECVEAPAVQRLGARLHLVPRVPGLSTSALVQRLTAC